MKKKLLFLVFFYIVATFFGQQADFNHISYKKADSIANVYKNENLHNLPLLAHKLTAKLPTDVEKFRAIYIWVCNNIKIDYNLTTKVLEKGEKYRNNRKALSEWNATMKAKFFKKLITEKKTMCTGYAFLTKELSTLANIDCRIINGYAKASNFNPNKPFPNHSWNAVKLNNKWYLCDATYANGYFNLKENKAVFDYNDGYFLTSPSLFIQNHYPENKKWMLIKNKHYELEEYLESPFIYSETYKHKITPVSPKKLKSTVVINEEIPFEFYTDSLINPKQLSLIQSNGWKDVAISPKHYTYKNGILKFKHLIFKKGLYDVHIKISDDIIASYTIKVIKKPILQNDFKYLINHCE